MVAASRSKIWDLEGSWTRISGRVCRFRGFLRWYIGYRVESGFRA